VATRTRAGRATPAKVAPRLPAIAFHPVTPERWDDFARLFGPRGACAGCWCMWPRLRGRDYAAGRGDGHRRRMRSIVAKGQQPGILAYVDGAPIGWCALAPRADYLRLASSRVMAPVDDLAVWSVPCLFVAREWRGRGVPARLLEAAVRFAGTRGARVVEGYPVDTNGKRTGDAFLWHGALSSFLRAGFREVARRSATRPIMRRSVRASRATSSRSATRG
jgi:GNAT superfamily N-acetyltransferase